MSYFIIKNNIKFISKENEKNTININFSDLKKYMDFIKLNYNLNNDNNDINEIIEIVSQLHLKHKIFFCDFKINENISNHIKLDLDNYNTLVTNKINYNIISKYNLIFRVDNILDSITIDYIYNLLQMYNEIVIYNCFITNLNSYRIYIVCLENKVNTNYTKNKIPYSFYLLIKNVYYQIIQNRFNNIKKNINQEKNFTLWKKMYLHT